MAIKNIMEDIILSTIDEIMKEDKFFAGVDRYKQDIAAYVLNRVPPKYITSERGILHGKLESRFLFQQKTDVILLIHEALEVIKARRDTPTQNIADSISMREWFFPHIIGEVLEETTFSIIPDVEVTLLYNDARAQMVDGSWDNPYNTNRGTLGYYHFWPEVQKSMINESKSVKFVLRFSHKKFKSKEMEILVPVLDDYNISYSRAVPIALLNLTDGIDVSFLYE
jgi:competence protein ComFB